jgi:hypothetical protein
MIDVSKFDHHPELSGSEFGTTLYEDILLRAQEPASVAAWSNNTLNGLPDTPANRYAQYLAFVNPQGEYGQRGLTTADSPYFQKVFGIMLHQTAMWVGIVVAIIVAILIVIAVMKYSAKAKAEEEY